ncbi:MAG TPA: rhodanese-like domain-containing protein [Chitinophagales bacterium]|nr:rhodanese-like domain-containing protein [Chitinophagales bacterium]HRK29080.1 rhodanese-like domain-containing protein [Chitinophagales bacterium]
MNTKHSYTNLLPHEFMAGCTHENAVILDVRTWAEYEERHLPGAVNIDIKQPDFMEEIASLNTEHPYYLYCRVGIRSANACLVMSRLGFNQLYNLKGGIEALNL